MPIYVLSAGEIKAKDGDRHYISAGQLQRLYGVNPADCIDHPIGSKARGWVPPSDAIFLYPRNDGNYKLPEA